MQDFMPSMGQVTYDNDQHVGLCSFNISNGIMNGLIGTRYGVHYGTVFVRSTRRMNSPE